MTIQIHHTTPRARPVNMPVRQLTAMIIVPCFNEAKRLNSAAFQAYCAEHANISFLFVDDGSTDDTPELLAQICAANPDRLIAMSLAKNAGKAEAVRQGMLHASTMGFDLVGYWDADLATPLDAIEDFMRVARQYRDVAVIFGSRRPMLGHRIHRTAGRRLVSKLCSALAYQALRLPISDTQCGAKLFRVTADLRASLKEPFSAGWLFDVELFMRLSQRLIQPRTAFYELPLAEWTEVAGSKVSARAIIRAGVQMLRLIGQSRLGWRTVSAQPTFVRPMRQISPSPKPHSNLAA